MTNWKENKLLNVIVRLIFVYSLSLYGLLFALELAAAGFVSFYFDVDIILMVVILSGCGQAYLDGERIEPRQKVLN